MKQFNLKACFLEVEKISSFFRHYHTKTGEKHNFEYLVNGPYVKNKNII